MRARSVCGEVPTGDVSTRLVTEHWPEGGHLGCPGLERALEAEFDISISELKRHVDEHVRCSPR